MLVGIFVLIQRGSLTQILGGTLFCAVYLLLQMQAAPFEDDGDDYLANGSSFALLVFFLCCLVFKMGALTEVADVQRVLSFEQKHDYSIPTLTVSISVLASALGTLALSFGMLLVQLAIMRHKLKLEAAIRRLPQCSWRLASGMSYACFLSHYKVQAGAEARYLKDSLDQMLGCPVYLDSSNLADLRSLFDEGVRGSEVLVLLLSEGLLTRPWCLLEIREAMRLKKPIVLLHLKGPAHGVFSFDDALAMLSDLEGEMPRRNEGCLDELRAHLDNGETIHSLGQTIVAALEMGRSVTSQQLELDINGTSNQLEAQLVDLIEGLAAATKRGTIKWTGTQPSRSLNRTNTSSALFHTIAAKVAKRTSVAFTSEGRSLDYLEEKVVVIHAREAEGHALRLRQAMIDTLGEQCFACEVPTTEKRLDRCLDKVRRSRFVLLVQTPEVVTQPWPLLAVYRAAIAAKPVVCVSVRGSGCARPTRSPYPSIPLSVRTYNAFATLAVDTHWAARTLAQMTSPVHGLISRSWLSALTLTPSRSSRGHSGALSRPPS